MRGIFLETTGDRREGGGIKTAFTNELRAYYICGMNTNLSLSNCDFYLLFSMGVKPGLSL